MGVLVHARRGEDGVGFELQADVASGVEMVFVGAGGVIEGSESTEICAGFAFLLFLLCLTSNLMLPFILTVS